MYGFRLDLHGMCVRFRLRANRHQGGYKNTCVGERRRLPGYFQNVRVFEIVRVVYVEPKARDKERAPCKALLVRPKPKNARRRIKRV
jgi:hypothetical protein